MVCYDSRIPRTSCLGSGVHTANSIVDGSETGQEGMPPFGSSPRLLFVSSPLLLGASQLLSGIIHDYYLVMHHHARSLTSSHPTPPPSMLLNFLQTLPPSRRNSRGRQRLSSSRTGPILKQSPPSSRLTVERQANHCPRRMKQSALAPDSLLMAIFSKGVGTARVPHHGVWSVMSDLVRSHYCQSVERRGAPTLDQMVGLPF